MKKMKSPELNEKNKKLIVQHKGGFILDKTGMKGRTKNDFIYCNTVEQLYQFALNLDIESFCCWYAYTKDNKYFVRYTEGSLFGDYDSDELYDDNGSLKKEVKQHAINLIKKDFNL
jgi:hypothetical protein